MTEKPSIWAGLSLEPAHIWHILLAVWILVMFGHSMTPADLSSKESGSVLAFLCSMLEGAGIGSSWLTEHLVRKTAHFCEYGVFGLLLMKNFYLLQGRRGRGYRQSLTPGIWWLFGSELLKTKPWRFFISKAGMQRKTG